MWSRVRHRKGKNQNINYNQTNTSVNEQTQHQTTPKKEETIQKKREKEVLSDIENIITESSPLTVISNENDFLRSLENQDEFKRLTSTEESVSTYFSQNFPSHSQLSNQKILDAKINAKEQSHLASPATVSPVRLSQRRLHLKSSHHHHQQDDNSVIRCINDYDKKQELLLLNHQISTEVAQFLSYELSDLNQGLHQDDLLMKKLESINCNSQNPQCEHQHDSTKPLSCFRCLQYGVSCKAVETKFYQEKNSNPVASNVFSGNEKKSSIQSSPSTSQSNRNLNKESTTPKKTNQIRRVPCNSESQPRVKSVGQSKLFQNHRDTVKKNKQLKIRNRNTVLNGGNSFTIRFCCCCYNLRSVSFDKSDTAIDFGNSVDLENIDKNKSDKLECDNHLTYQASVSGYIQNQNIVLENQECPVIKTEYDQSMTSSCQEYGSSLKLVGNASGRTDPVSIGIGIDIVENDCIVNDTIEDKFKLVNAITDREIKLENDEEEVKSTTNDNSRPSSLVGDAHSNDVIKKLPINDDTIEVKRNDQSNIYNEKVDDNFDGGYDVELEFQETKAIIEVSKKEVNGTKVISSCGLCEQHEDSILGTKTSELFNEKLYDRQSSSYSQSKTNNNNNNINNNNNNSSSSNYSAKLNDNDKNETVDGTHTSNINSIGTIVDGSIKDYNNAQTRSETTESRVISQPIDSVSESSSNQILNEARLDVAASLNKSYNNRGTRINKSHHVDRDDADEHIVFGNSKVHRVVYYDNIVENMSCKHDDDDDNDNNNNDDNNDDDGNHMDRIKNSGTEGSLQYTRPSAQATESASFDTETKRATIIMNSNSEVAKIALSDDDDDAAAADDDDDDDDDDDVVVVDVSSNKGHKQFQEIASQPTSGNNKFRQRYNPCNLVVRQQHGVNEKRSSSLSSSNDTAVTVQSGGQTHSVHSALNHNLESSSQQEQPQKDSSLGDNDLQVANQVHLDDDEQHDTVDLVANGGGKANLEERHSSSSQIISSANKIQPSSSSNVNNNNNNNNTILHSKQRKASLNLPSQTVCGTKRTSANYLNNNNSVTPLSSTTNHRKHDTSASDSSTDHIQIFNISTLGSVAGTTQLWSISRNPEWHPRRASVATCQLNETTKSHSSGHYSANSGSFSAGYNDKCYTNTTSTKKITPNNKSNTATDKSVVNNTITPQQQQPPPPPPPPLSAGRYSQQNIRVANYGGSSSASQQQHSPKQLQLFEQEQSSGSSSSIASLIRQKQQQHINTTSSACCNCNCHAQQRRLTHACIQAMITSKSSNNSASLWSRFRSRTIDDGQQHDVKNQHLSNHASLLSKLSASSSNHNGSTATATTANNIYNNNIINNNVGASKSISQSNSALLSSQSNLLPSNNNNKKTPSHAINHRTTTTKIPLSEKTSSSTQSIGSCEILGPSKRHPSISIESCPPKRDSDGSDYQEDYGIDNNTLINPALLALARKTSSSSSSQAKVVNYESHHGDKSTSKHVNSCDSNEDNCELFTSINCDKHHHQQQQHQQCSPSQRDNDANTVSSSENPTRSRKLANIPSFESKQLFTQSIPSSLCRNAQLKSVANNESNSKRSERELSDNPSNLPKFQDQQTLDSGEVEPQTTTNRLENLDHQLESTLEEDEMIEAILVESWLDDHQAFVNDYFMRRATRKLIDDWLSSRTLAGIATGSCSRISLASSSRPNSGATTPVRKISATDFETSSNSGFLRPMVSTTPDGVPTFLPLNNSKYTSSGQHRSSCSMASSTTDDDEYDSSGDNCPNDYLDDTNPNGSQAVSERLNNCTVDEESEVNSESNEVVPVGDGNVLTTDSDTISDLTSIKKNKFDANSTEGASVELEKSTLDSRKSSNSNDNRTENQSNSRPPSRSSPVSTASANTHLMIKNKYPILCGQQLRHFKDISSPELSQDLLQKQQFKSSHINQSKNNLHYHRSSCHSVLTPKTSDQSNKLLRRSHHQRRHQSVGSMQGANLHVNNDLDSLGLSRDQLDKLDEIDLIFELVKNICNDLDIRSLFHKILKNVAILINADRSSLFLIKGEKNDINRHLVSQLFDVDRDSKLSDEPLQDSDCIKIPWGKGIVGYVAESGESVNIPDCYKDSRFSNIVDQRTGYTTKNMLCSPIFDDRDEIIGVAQVINKKGKPHFSDQDEKIFAKYLQFCGIGLRNAQLYEYSQLENRRNQVLLDLARMIFEEQSTIEQVVYRIMLHIQSLLDCQRCQVLLIGDNDLTPQISSVLDDRQRRDLQPTLNEKLSREKPSQEAICSVRNKWKPTTTQNISSDKVEGCSNCHKNDDEDENNDGEKKVLPGELDERRLSQTSNTFSLIFDLKDDNEIIMTDSTLSGQHRGSGSDSRFPINIGITGYVAATGETLNIEDAYLDKRFDPMVDEGTNFRHKSILCMPIKNASRKIIGVSQLINKKNGQPFNKNDENLFEAFAIFCGLGIHNTLMYEKVLKIMAKQRVTFEVLSYHATAPLEEAIILSNEIIPSTYALRLADVRFNDFSLDESMMLRGCLRMFMDLDFVERFQIDYTVLCRWILSVRKNYRKLTYHPIVGGTGLKATPVRYHNWRHAFNVCQMMFALLTNTQLCRVFGELETLALIVGCLCHDLDHRGTNNSFQIKSSSPLAELYSTSTMEHHHFDQCIMILNSQGNQILSSLSPSEYSKVIHVLEEAILATDLAKYFQKRDKFFNLINAGQLDWRNNEEHRSLLRCMLMTACDVAAITKPWPIQKVVADLVMSEFYQQGDIEKTELKMEPIDMMNRDKMNELPEMQIKFIDTICAPIYGAFGKLFPNEMGPLYEGCLSNRVVWSELAQEKCYDFKIASPMGVHVADETNNLIKRVCGDSGNQDFIKKDVRRSI